MDSITGAMFMWNELTTGMQAIFESADNSLRKIITSIEELDRRILVLAADLKQLNTSAVLNPALIGDDDVNEYVPGYVVENNRNTDERQPAEILKTIEGMRDLADHTEQVIKAFDNLPVKVKNMDSMPDIMRGISAGANSIADISSAKDGMKTTAQGVAIAGTTMAEILELVAAAGIELTPAGWVLAAGAAVYTGISAINDKEQEGNLLRQVTSENLYRKNLQSFFMSESDADKYADQTIDSLHFWKPSYTAIKRNFEDYGPGAYDISFRQNINPIDNLGNHPNLPPGFSYTAEDALPVTRSYLEKTDRLQQTLKVAAMDGGRNQLDNVAFNELVKARRYDKEHGTNTLQITESAVREVKQNYTNAANEGRVMSNTSRNGQTRESQYGTQGHSNRTININLNKPMIDHFTINVKDAKEGINDLKYQVEEMLLEILNSANAIR